MLGLFLMTLGFGLWVDYPAYTSWPRIAIYQIILGIGLSPGFQGTLLATQANIKNPQDVAMGTSALMFVRLLSTAIGVVVGQVIFQSVMSRKLNEFLRAGIDSSMAHDLAGGNAVAMTFQIQALGPAQLDVVRKAITDSLRKTWIFFVGSSAVGLLAAFGINTKKLSREHTEVRTGLHAYEKEKRDLGREAG